MQKNVWKTKVKRAIQSRMEIKENWNNSVGVLTSQQYKFQKEKPEEVETKFLKVRKFPEFSDCKESTKYILQCLKITAYHQRNFRALGIKRRFYIFPEWKKRNRSYTKDQKAHWLWAPLPVTRRIWRKSFKILRKTVIPTPVKLSTQNEERLKTFFREAGLETNLSSNSFSASYWRACFWQMREKNIKGKHMAFKNQGRQDKERWEALPGWNWREVLVGAEREGSSQRGAEEGPGQASRASAAPPCSGEVSREAQCLRRCWAASLTVPMSLKTIEILWYKK